MKKRTIFLIVCAAVFALGIILSGIGIISGGVKGIDKIAENYDWINGSIGELKTKQVECGDFDSISINSKESDVFVMSEEYAAGLGSVVIDDPKAGSVYLIYGENTETPQVEYEKGELNIQEKKRPSGITLDLGWRDGSPAIVVVCEDGTNGQNVINSIKINSGYSDIECMGISAKSIETDTTDGDLNLEHCYFDCAKAVADYGDVNIISDEKAELYSVDAFTEYGDIEVDAVDFSDDGGRYTITGGDKSIVIKTVDGDIGLTFGNAGLPQHYHEDHH